MTPILITVGGKRANESAGQASIRKDYACVLILATYFRTTVWGVRVFCCGMAGVFQRRAKLVHAEFFNRNGLLTVSACCSVRKLMLMELYQWRRNTT